MDIAATEVDGSLIEALLSIRIPELCVTPATEKYDVEINCQIAGHSDKAGWGIVTMSGDDELLDRILERTRRHPSVGSVKVQTRDPGSVSFLVDVVKCKTLRGFNQFQSFPSFSCTHRARAVWTAIIVMVALVGMYPEPWVPGRALRVLLRKP